MIIAVLRKVLRSRTGATAIEYAMIAALIAVAATGAMVSVADLTIGMWNGIADNMVEI